jgi:hypothetical protein
MVYIIRATSTERGEGTFTAKAETRRQAIASAKRLRSQGFQVTITGPDGEPVDETEDE